MITRIKINQLFNIYNYDIDLTNIDGSAVKFITAPNGYGKTTILDLVEAAIRQLGIGGWLLMKAGAAILSTVAKALGRPQTILMTLYDTVFTLIYHNGQFNRPDTLLLFLQVNSSKSPQIQIDCIIPYNGTAGPLMD